MILSQIRGFGAELICSSTSATAAAPPGLRRRVGRDGRPPYGPSDRGKKTLGLEIAEQFGWSLPDVIVYPTGGGAGLIGMWKAFGG
jgi:threonine dehydratase